MPKGDNDIKGNSEKARERGKLKKGVKHKETLLKEAIGIDRTTAIREQIEKNIDEFIHSTDAKIRMDATKAFTDYYKPRKKESTIEMKGTINLIVNSKIVGDKKTE